MEIAIIRRETTGSGPNVFNENETIAKYEIMDGSPVRGESIPIRVFLAGYDLTPTMRDINKKFSVRYYLNLVLVDEEERRYFKQQVIVHFINICFLKSNNILNYSFPSIQEITLWRKGDRMRKSLQMAPVTTPTSNGESDQLQAFEKVPTPVSEEPPLTEDA